MAQTEKQKNLMRSCMFEHDGVKYYVANSLEGPGRDDSLTGVTLWEFQFGSVGTTHILVWGGRNSNSSVRGIEDALEEAAEALADWGLKGHFVDDKEIAELMAEAQTEDPELSEEEAYEKATEDLTYTESGHIASYEWYVNEHHDGDPLFARAAKKSMRDRRAEGWE